MRRATRCFLVPIVAVAISAAAARAEPSRQDLIGQPTLYVTQESDTLLDIGVRYDVGYVAIRAANPGVDPWLPGAGKQIQVPTQHILPQAPHRGIVVNLPELRLYYFPPDGGPVQSFPIGIGGEGKETPVGHTRIVAKRVHPVWIPTKSEHKDDPDLPQRVGPGPDNPMGDYALYLGWRGYAIHGSNKPYSIGRRDSHGCIRLLPQDIERLYHWAKIGTPVTVVNQQVKVGREGDELYLEVHASQDDADSIEQTGAPRSSRPVDADNFIRKAAGKDAPRLDWYRIHLAEMRRDGIPVQITRPSPFGIGQYRSDDAP